MGGIVGAALKSGTHAAVMVSQPVHAGAGRDERPDAPDRNDPMIASRPTPSEQIAEAPVMMIRSLTTVRLLRRHRMLHWQRDRYGALLRQLLIGPLDGCQPNSILVSN
jgi:hypothetical protein